MSAMPEVGFAMKPLPGWLRMANAVADRTGAIGRRLTPERLVADSAAVAGLPPRFPAHVGEALEVLCRSLRDEAGLHWFGEMNQYNLLVTGLAALLRVEKQFADDPSLANEPLLAPTIVTGLPRSGTTYFHRLLSAEPEALGVPLHRHMMPVAHGSPDLRRYEVHVKFYPWQLASQVYGLDAIHFVRPELPDECNFGMRLAGRSMIFWATAPTPTYLRWLLAQDLRETYQLYRKVLILHQREAPGRRLTLKCPHHLASLPALSEAIPEALVVQTHRDPVETIPSECKLVLSLQALSTDRLDWRRTVEGNYFKIRTFAERAVAFAGTPEGARVHHVDYRQLLRDPVAAVRTVHERTGVAFTETHEVAVRQFAEENRQNKHGKNQYSAGQFELDPSRLGSEFADYRERFLGAQP